MTTSGASASTPVEPQADERPWGAGEWHIEGYETLGGTRRVTISYGINDYRDGPEGYVCAVCEGFDGRGEARARLIVAAPELAEAVQALVTRFWQGYPDGPDSASHSLTEPDRALWKRAEAALRKARGEA